jgi:cell wall integrity and stress response component
MRTPLLFCSSSHLPCCYAPAILSCVLTTDIQTSSTTTSTSTTPSSTPASTPSSTTTSFSLSSTQAAVVTSSPSSTAADTSSLSHTTFVSTRVVTVSGGPVTQTVTSTAVVTPGASLRGTEQKGISGGTVAGAVIGAVVGVALLLAGAFFLWRRKQSEAADPESPRSGSGSGSARRRMERNTSVLSKTGLLSSVGTAVDMEKFHDESAAGHKYHGSESTAPIPNSPDGDRRNSRPLVYDQRLNPAALMEHWERNGSRASIQDQRDYSRPLGVTNPDPLDD